MIPLRKLSRTVLQNAMRDPRQFVLSAFGVVVGVAALVFFLALSSGIRTAIIALFPLERVEVEAPKTSIAGLDLSKKITDSTVAAILAQIEAPVKTAMPRMALQFPMLIKGWWGGQRIVSEYLGDGIDASFIGDPKLSELFRDWEQAEELQTLQPCGLPPSYECPQLWYCDRRDLKCHHNVPVVISPALLEIFNKQYAPSRGLPVIGADIQAFIRARGLNQMRLYFTLGDGGIGAGEPKAPPRTVEGTLVGVSDRAIDLGGTMPMQYIARWNREYSGEAAATEYSSVVVELQDKDDVAALGAWLNKELGLKLSDSQGEKFSLIITVVTLLFVLISIVIVLIAAINITHNFFMQVGERRGEIGLMRALGATRADVGAIFIGEAVFLGIVAGMVGVLLGVGAGALADYLLATRVPEFAFKPDSFFKFELWNMALGAAVAIFFAVVGGALPARRAASMLPARALAQR